METQHLDLKIEFSEQNLSREKITWLPTGHQFEVAHLVMDPKWRLEGLTPDKFVVTAMFFRDREHKQLESHLFFFLLDNGVSHDALNAELVEHIVSAYGKVANLKEHYELYAFSQYAREKGIEPYPTYERYELKLVTSSSNPKRKLIESVSPDGELYEVIDSALEPNFDPERQSEIVLQLRYQQLFEPDFEPPIYFIRLKGHFIEPNCGIEYFLPMINAYILETVGHFDLIGEEDFGNELTRQMFGKIQ